MIEVAGPEDPVTAHVWDTGCGELQNLATDRVHEVGMAVPFNPLAAQSRPQRLRLH